MNKQEVLQKASNHCKDCYMHQGYAIWGWPPNVSIQSKIEEVQSSRQREKARTCLKELNPDENHEIKKLLEECYRCSGTSTLIAPLIKDFVLKMKSPQG